MIVRRRQDQAHANQSKEIVEVQLHTGGRLPFMVSKCSNGEKIEWEVEDMCRLHIFE